MAQNKHWEQDKEATVYIGNLDERVTDAIVWELMLQAGRIVLTSYRYPLSWKDPCRVMLINVNWQHRSMSIFPKIELRRLTKALGS